MRAQAYRHGFLHGTCVPAEERSSIAARSLVAKVMTVDGCVSNLGSANLNQRSISLDEEINVVVIEPSLVELLDRHFDDLRSALQQVEQRGTADPALLDVIAGSGELLSSRMVAAAISFMSSSCSSDRPDHSAASDLANRSMPKGRMAGSTSPVSTRWAM